MRVIVLIVGLALAATACGEASAGDSDEALGELVLPCDIVYVGPARMGAVFYASATPEDLPGAFTAFYCDFVDAAERPVVLPDPCDGQPDCPTTSNIVCRMAEPETINRVADGSYWFDCGSTFVDERATIVRVLR